MCIRQMIAGDIAAVTAIERESSSPWTQAQVAAELERELGVSLVSVSLSGATQGWCCGIQIASEAELFKITVVPTCRRQGVGEALLHELCEQLAARGAKKMYLEVRSRNVAARKFYVTLGWQQAENRKNYYSNPVDDAVVFMRLLNN